ncbi:hypothetical protein MRB53_020528 [Persea americana]|uniref:Uncharacterized protein n=1 Tax=Persea americana TaxID=3435 RepID=A0ACC2L120_PERAE|nr:hypothetical protein MRB53_020528 [Persea americana]
MDTKLQKKVNLNKPPTHNVFTRDPNGDELRYTSLRDIIPQLPTTKGAITNHDRSFVDSANISISNQLVKQAASAYLQSAAILASRNESFPGSLWEDARSSATFHSIWRNYVDSNWMVLYVNLIRFEMIHNCSQLDAE